MKTIRLLCVLAGVFALSACGSADKGEKLADKFFKRVIHEKFAEAGNLLEVGPDENAAQIAETFGHHPDYGKLQSARKSMGFHTNVTNGITTVRLPYTLKYEQEKISVEVTLVDRGSGFKINGIR